MVKLPEFEGLEKRPLGWGKGRVWLVPFSDTLATVKHTPEWNSVYAELEADPTVDPLNGALRLVKVGMSQAVTPAIWVTLRDLTTRHRHHLPEDVSLDRVYALIIHLADHCDLRQRNIGQHPRTVDTLLEDTVFSLEPFAVTWRDHYRKADVRSRLHFSRDPVLPQALANAIASAEDLGFMYNVLRDFYLAQLPEGTVLPWEVSVSNVAETEKPLTGREKFLKAFYLAEGVFEHGAITQFANEIDHQAPTYHNLSGKLKVSSKRQQLDWVNFDLLTRIKAELAKEDCSSQLLERDLIALKPKA